MLTESQENDVFNDVLFERKYSQLFTHESNIFLLKQLSGKQIYRRRAAMTPQSIYRLFTDKRKCKQNSISASFTPFTWRI